MKKYAFLILILFLQGIVLSQTITVTAPAAGDRWEKGSAHDITWSSTGCSDTDIKINIFRDRVDPATFVEQILCTDTGVHRWRIPESYDSGNYIIRVKTADNICRGDSGLFEIYSVPVVRETPEIEVTAPDSSTDWDRGTLKRIIWRKTGEMADRVKIHLMNAAGTTTVHPISTLTQNDLSHLWNIPADLATGRYRIRVQTLDGDVTGLSPVFDITRAITLAEQVNPTLEARVIVPGTLQPVIRVMYPNGGEILTRGSRVEIRWECVEGFNPPKIKIQKNGRTVRTYGPERLYPVPSRGGYIWPWIIPSDLAPGSDYKVRIEKGDFSRSNDLSDANFTISSDIHIEVAEPRGGGHVATNGKIIRWRAGGAEGNMNVHLKKDGTEILQLIRSSVPEGTTRFLWYVGSLASYGTITSGDRYRVVVSTADGSASGESAVFQIIVPALEVLSPGSSEKRRGDTLDIRWNNTPGFHGNVDVILEKEQGSSWIDYETLFTNTHDKGLSWRIPPAPGFGEAEVDPFPTGVRYRIKVKSVRCPHLVIARGSWFRVR